jgi:hypothetical protein
MRFSIACAGVEDLGMEFALQNVNRASHEVFSPGFYSAAVSRLRPIQDASDFWHLMEERSHRATDSGGSAPDVPISAPKGKPYQEHESMGT